jgi:hypothetical protein
MGDSEIENRVRNAFLCSPHIKRVKLCGAWPRRTARLYAHPEAGAT